MWFMKLHVFAFFYTSVLRLFFSSPEPKAPGEVIGWEGCCRPSTLLNNFSSETTVTKFHV